MWGVMGTSISNLYKQLTCTICLQLPRLSSLSHTHTLRHFNRILLPSTFSSPRHQCRAFSSKSATPSLPLYHSVLIKCPKHLSDAFSEALLSFGANSVSMDEHDDYEDFEEVNICSIFTGNGDVTSCITCAAHSIGIETPAFEFLKYDPYDWIKRTQESFDPVEVTKGLWVVPEWKSIPDPRATNIILNPGLAFGTGEHATTKMCLLLLHETVKGGEHFLDYGTGSGILSIAALKLGASLSVGVDIDPQAISASSQNAELNNIDPENLKLCLLPSENGTSFNNEKVQEDVYTKDFSVDKSFIQTKKYDIVIANILLNPLLALAGEIVSHAKVGATLGLSGVLRDQVSSVIERYSPFLEDISVSELGDWACIKGRKKNRI